MTGLWQEEYGRKFGAFANKTRFKVLIKSLILNHSLTNISAISDSCNMALMDPDALSQGG